MRNNLSPLVNPTGEIGELQQYEDKSSMQESQVTLNIY